MENLRIISPVQHWGKKIEKVLTKRFKTIVRKGNMVTGVSDHCTLVLTVAPIEELLKVNVEEFVNTLNIMASEIISHATAEELDFGSHEVSKADQMLAFINRYESSKGDVICGVHSTPRYL